MRKQYSVRVRRPIHGTGIVEIGEPIKWWGGIFKNQPRNPNSQYRRGIFEAHYARDPRFADDDGILAPYTLQPIAGTVMHSGMPLFEPGGGLAGIYEDIMDHWSSLTPRGQTWATAGILAAAMLLLRR